MHPKLEKWLVTGRKVADAFAPIAALATRLAYGKQFMVTGWGKWSNLDNTTQNFANFGLPMPRANAVLVATVELVGGACLVLGLGTRLSAALLSATMVVALMTAERSNFTDSLHWSGDATGVSPLVYLMALLWLISYGGGPASVDAQIARNLPKSGS